MKILVINAHPEPQSFNYWEEVMDFSASVFDGKDRELVLGRRT